jgi:hypothetical protein
MIQHFIEWVRSLSGESFPKMLGFEFMPSRLVSPIAATIPLQMS